MKNSHHLRLFIAANLPEEFHTAMKQGQLILRKHASVIHCPDPNNTHLTFRFLGDVSDNLLPDIIRQLKSIHISTDTYLVALTHWGAFRRRDGLLIWQGLTVSPNCFALAIELEKYMQTLGFPPENRPWKPHITVARQVKLTTPLSVLEKQLPLIPTPQPLRELILFQSEFVPGGMRYTPLFKSPLYQ